MTKLRAGDRYRFRGLEGENDLLPGPGEITVANVTWDGTVLLSTDWGENGVAERGMPLMEVVELIRQGIWEPAEQAGTEPPA